MAITHVDAATHSHRDRAATDPGAASRAWSTCIFGGTSRGPAPSRNVIGRFSSGMGLLRAVHACSLC